MTPDPTDPQPGTPEEAAETVPAGAVRPVDLRDYVRFRLDAATRVRVFATDVLTVDLWCLEPQQATAVLRYEDVDVAYTVVGGRAWFVTDEGEVGLDALGALLVPAGTAHGIDNHGVDPLVVLATASPPDVAVGDLVTDPPHSDGREAVHEESSGRETLLRGLLRRVRRT